MRTCWSAAILLVGGLLPDTQASMAASSIDDRHSQTVICIPDKPVDTVLSYYVSSGEHPFCMNGGTCKADFAQDPEFPCDCPTGLTGPHCEFEEGIVPQCELDCYNGGRCQVGIKYPDETIFESNRELQYCICREGYYGRTCEVEGKQCGAAHCFNGGSCVKIEQTDGTVTDHCDCTDAGDDEVSFAGRFCQSPSTVFCSKFEDHNGKHFCVNGGQCRGDSHLGCDCPGGFTGPVCEFRVRDEMQHEGCDLACQNNGICRKGAKDLSVLENFNVNRAEGSLVHSSHNDDFEHCVCPIGFVGLTCEFRLDVCPGGTHACMHGAECKRRVNTETHTLEFQCDCDKADEFGLRYTGRYCQLESTEFCTEDGLRPSVDSDAFCVNGGSCLGFVPQGHKHPGCECKSEFHGTHCEYDRSDSASKDIDDDAVRGGMAISLTIGCTLLVFLIVFFVVYRRQKRREMAFRPKDANYYRDDVDEYLESDGDFYDEPDGINAAAKAPTIEDLDLMIDTIGEETPQDLILYSDGDNKSTSLSQICSEPYTLGMSSMGTNGSNGSFVEDPQTGRAMLMKETINADDAP